MENSKQYYMTRESSLHLFAESLITELSLDQPDLDLFEMAIEEEFADRVAKSVDFFQSDPEKLALDLHDHLSDLIWLESFFAHREEYERCLIIQSQRGIIERRLLRFRKKKASKFSLPKGRPDFGAEI